MRSRLRVIAIDSGRLSLFGIEHRHRAYRQLPFSHDGIVLQVLLYPSQRLHSVHVSPVPDLLSLSRQLGE